MKIPFTDLRFEVVTYKYSQIDIIPKRYHDFLVDMNSTLFFNDSDVYLGREKEVNQIFNVLLKSIYPNLILLGEHGVGKNAVVHSLVYHVLKEKCPKDLKNRHFIYWDIEKILPNLASSDDRVQKKIAESFEFLVKCKDEIVVIIDQIHLMACSPLLLYYLTVLRKTGVKLIGMTTEDEFYDYFYTHKIASTIDTMNIAEPRDVEVYPMIKEYVKILEIRHGVTMSEDVINYAISVSSAFPSNLYNPGLAIDFIERSMIIAKRRKHTEVTKKDVNSNFNFKYKLYNKMSYNDKKITAYHEAGHFLVIKMSENIRNYKTKAITIVPAENFLGLTMFEFEVEKQTTCDADYFIDSIAADLAGRVAETLLQKDEGKAVKYSSGAYADLKQATKTARDIVTEYGMIDSCGKNMTYFCNYDMSDLALLSEQRKELIDIETQKIIEEAYLRAEKILSDNRKLLDLLAKELLSNEVLDEKDLDRICAQVETTK